MQNFGEIFSLKNSICFSEAVQYLTINPGKLCHIVNCEIYAVFKVQSLSVILFINSLEVFCQFGCKTFTCYPSFNPL